MLVMTKCIFLFFVCSLCNAQNINITREWGTYFRDERFVITDSAVNSQGYLYIVGRVLRINNQTPNFFSNSGQNSIYNSYRGGNSDGFILMFDPIYGQDIWASYFGGPGDDTLSSITIDADDNLYILGSTNSTTGVATTNAYQTTKNEGYDFMLARISANHILNWCTYYGGNGNEFVNAGANATDVYSPRSANITHDNSNNLYFTGTTYSSNLGTANTFQPLIKNATQAITKFTDAGNLVWTTYYTENDAYMTAISLSDTGVYVSGTFEYCEDMLVLDPPDTYYGTLNSFVSQSVSCWNQFLSKFDFAGQRIWSTYYENNLLNLAINDNLKVFQDKVYFSGSSVEGLPATPGTFQPDFGPFSNNVTPFLAKFDQDGTRDWATYNGLTNNPPGFANTCVTVDTAGNSYISGIVEDRFIQNFATQGAYQATSAGIQDGYICKFDSTGQKIWGTYYGGEAAEYTMQCHPYQDGFFVVGTTISTTGLATETVPPLGPLQFTLFDPNTTAPQNMFVAKFTVGSLSTNNNQLSTTKLIPNPNTGSFSINANFEGLKDLDITIYDNQGRTIYTKKIGALNNTSFILIDLENKIESGIYFVKIETDQIEKTIKFVVR